MRDFIFKMPLPMSYAAMWLYVFVMLPVTVIWFGIRHTVLFAIEFTNGTMNEMVWSNYGALWERQRNGEQNG